MTTSLASELDLEELDDGGAPVFPEWPELVGRQEPEHLLVDEGDQSEADKAITLAARVRKAQLPWQEATLRGILTLEPDGLFTHPTSVVIAPRQNGKTLSAAELRIVFGAFVRRETIVYSAQRWLTAKAIYLRIKRLIGSRASLRRRASGWLCSQGVAAFTVHHDDGTENVVMFITRSGDFRGPDEIDLVIYDEAYNLTDSEMSAISPTQLASKNPQTIYLSSAVNQELQPNGQVLAGIRARALDAIKRGLRKTGLYFAEHMAPLPPEGISEAERRRIREDPATWRQGNPSYGVIQTEAKVRKLLTELSAKVFEVEILGWGDWPVVEQAVPRAISAELWGDLEDLEPGLVNGWPRVIAVDRSPATKVWAIGGVQFTDSGTVHGEIGFRQAASATDVVEKLVDIVTEADPVALVIDQRSPAAVLKPYLMAVGIEPVMTNTSELALACEGWLEACGTHQFSHSGQQLLDDSVAATIKRELPGERFAWAAISGGSIVETVAITLAHWGLLTFARPPKRSAPPMADHAETRSEGVFEGDFDAMTAPF